MKLTVMGRIDSQDMLNQSVLASVTLFLANLNKIGYIHLPTSYG